MCVGATSAVGGLTGAVILLNTPEKVFRGVVPWLIAFAAVLVAVQPRVAAAMQRLPGGSGEHRSSLLHVGVFVGTVYGGYFGAGGGVLLLGILGLFLPGEVQPLNALRALVLIVNTVALVVFALFGPVVWSAVWLMGASSLAGGWIGATVVRRLDASILRATIVVFVQGWRWPSSSEGEGRQPWMSPSSHSAVAVHPGERGSTRSMWPRPSGSHSTNWSRCDP